MQKLITKNTFLNATVCPRLGWLAHHGELPEGDSLDAEFRIMQGVEINERARKLFPSGILIPRTMQKAITETSTAIKNNPILFEPAFSADGFGTRADVLCKDGNGWNLIEVKSGKNLSDEYIKDAAYTAMVLIRAGLQIKTISLMLVSGDYRKGMPDKKLFVTEDITKEAKNQFDNKKLFKYCVAIANEGGGQLLLGIADAPPRPVVGTAAFNDPVAMAEKLFRAVGFRVDIEEVSHPDGRVLVFHIPSRPRGTAYHLDGAYLMRSGEELVPMSEDRLRNIFAEGEPDWLEEASVQGIDAQGVIELLDTQTFFELMKLPYPTDRAGVLDRLVQERLIDKQDTGYSIRRLGAILLAKRFEDFADIARKLPRVVVYPGTSKLQTKLDQPGTKGYAVGFQGLVPKQCIFSSEIISLC